jgi:hypothetical protein
MPGPRPVWTPDEGAIAQESVENRWPKILSGILDDVELGIEASSDCLPQRAQGRALVHHFFYAEEGYRE